MITYTCVYIFFILQLKVNRKIESTSYLFTLLDILKQKCIEIQVSLLYDSW